MDEKNGKSVVIVGGGLSGLSVAHYLCKQGFDPSLITIMESGDRLGGKIYSFDMSENDEGIEHGAGHILDYYTEVFNLLKEYGLEDKLQHAPKPKLAVEGAKSLFKFLLKSAEGVCACVRACLLRFGTDFLA